MLNNITEFLNIIRAISIHHAPPDLCGRINTFGVVEQMTQLNSDNGEWTQQHFEDGLFWARDWHNGGCDPNKLQKEYDLLVVRAFSVEPYKEDTHGKKWVYPLHLNIIGQVKCEFCPDGCVDTKEGRRLQVAQTLQHVLDEMMTYQKYNVTTSEAENMTVWASEAQKEYLIGNGTWATATVTGIRLDTYIRNEAFDIFVPDWSSLGRINRRIAGKESLMDGVVAVAVAVYVEVCDPITPFGFDYETHDVQELGIVKCC